MENYVIKIKLLSESIFGCGSSQNNGVDIDILKDEIGVPYFKGKSFKGKLREEADYLTKYINSEKVDLKKVLNDLFGEKGEFNNNTLKFSDCKISENIWKNLKYAVDVKKIISKDDIVDSFTEIRSFTRINENGYAEKGSLRQARVIKKDLVLYCNVESINPLNEIEKGFLSASISALRNLGSMESRGKGLVSCRLFQNENDITDEYINLLEKEV